MALNRERSTEAGDYCVTVILWQPVQTSAPFTASLACYPWSWMSCAVLALHKAFLIQTLGAAKPNLAWTKSFSVQSAVTDSPAP